MWLCHGSITPIFWVQMATTYKKREKAKAGYLKLISQVIYPKHLQKSNNDYPLEPEELSVKKEWLSSYQTDLLDNKSMLNTEKPVPDLMDKEENMYFVTETYNFT